MSKVFTIGEILVEIMASKIGQPFDQPGIWNGPYPSGAPAIFIDQVTRLGVPCSIISCVGNDGFGDINIHRLAADGVDIRGFQSYLWKLPGVPLLLIITLAIAILFLISRMPLAVNYRRSMLMKIF